MAQRLLERVASEVSASSTRDEGGVTRTSVRLYIEALINTRRGGSGSRPDLGLPELGADGGEAGDTLSSMARWVRQCLADFEPRLDRVDVRPDRDKQGVLLAEGRLRLNRGYERVTYEIDLGHAGTIRVT